MKLTDQNLVFIFFIQGIEAATEQFMRSHLSDSDGRKFLVCSHGMLGRQPGGLL